MIKLPAPQKEDPKPDDGAPVARGRFCNNDGRHRVSTSDFLRWRLGLRKEAGDKGRPVWEAIPLQEARCFDGDSQPGITWIGHATLLYQLRGLTLLTDPIFSSLPNIKRHQPPALSLGALPELDAVLISHNHMDHLDRHSVMGLSRDQLFVVPLGMASWFHRRGRRHVVELDWWESVRLGDYRITFVPAQHWSRRSVLDENRSLWGGFVVEGPDTALYYSGDTAYFEGFAEIGERLKPEVALLPIGAYTPRWIMQGQHLDPTEALQAFGDLGAKVLLPIHWGCFRLSEEPLGEPPAWLEALAKEKGLEEQVHLWPIGGGYPLKASARVVKGHTL